MLLAIRYCRCCTVRFVALLRPADPIVCIACMRREGR
jgi:hypothetical protein